MSPTAQLNDRRTNVDVVFDHLYDAITNLDLLPGDKISEAEIAAQFDVSRQPVRDAFNRLENLDLLRIRPQRATEVRRFSAKEITKSRFIRASVEAEVLRRAARLCDAEGARRLRACLDEQQRAVDAPDYVRFGRLDYEFHKALCEIAKVDFAFEVIAAEKARVDRLCLLSISKEDRMPQLVEDHADIVRHVENHDAEGAVAAGMVHLSRLDATIETISKMNPDYFDP